MVLSYKLSFWIIFIFFNYILIYNEFTNKLICIKILIWEVKMKLITRENIQAQTKIYLST